MFTSSKKEKRIIELENELRNTKFTLSKADEKIKWWEEENKKLEDVMKKHKGLNCKLSKEICICGCGRMLIDGCAFNCRYSEDLNDDPTHYCKYWKNRK